MPAPEKPGSPELQDEKSKPYYVEKASGRASREQPQPTGKAGAAQKVQENNLTRLCKHDPCDSITRLHDVTNSPRQASEVERPVLAIQPQPWKRVALWL